MKIKNILIVLFLLTSSCNNNDDNNYIAQVGNTLIKEKHIEYKTGLDRIVMNRSLSSNDAVVLLINDAIELELANLYGIKITSKDIDEHSKQIEQSNRTEIVKDIKNVFSNDITSYRALYLKRKLVSSKLKDFFAKNKSSFNAPTIIKIKEAYNLVIRGEDFKKVGKQTGISYRKYKVGHVRATEKALPDSLKGYMSDQKGGTSEDPLIVVLKSMKNNSIHRNVIEDSSSYKILKLIKKDDSSYLVEKLQLKKMALEEWFKDGGSKINVKIVQPKLKKDLKEEFPDLWWLKNL